MAETTSIAALSTIDAEGLSLRPWQPRAILQLAAWSAKSASVLAAHERALFGDAIAGPGTALILGGLRLWPVAPWRRLLIAEAGAVLPISPAGVATVPYTGGFAGLRLDGARSCDLLAKLVAVDLHPEALGDNGFVSARLEGVRVHLQRAGADAFDLLIPASTAEFAIGALADGTLEYGARIDPALLHRPTPQASPRAVSLRSSHGYI